jgi:hypothetical protein
MSRFEAWAKRRFTSTETMKFHFPVPGIGDDQDLNVHRGFFLVTVEEMRGIFLPVLEEILNLALKQINSSKSPVKAALVVGGFGQNYFLREYLKANIPSGISVLAPPDD